jgi:integrase
MSITEPTPALGQAPALEVVADRALVFGGRTKLRDALSVVPSKNATTDGLQRAAELARAAADAFDEEVKARAVDTLRKKAGYDPKAVLYDKLGRPRSPATAPGYMAGRRAPNRGRKYPPSSLTTEDIMLAISKVEDVSKNDLYAERLRALILVLWRAGLRISEGLALLEGDLNQTTGEVFVRRGKGGRSRTVGVDDWVWPLLQPWLEIRRTLPQGPLFCVLEGKTAGVDAWGASSARDKFVQLEKASGLRKRFRPHQLRHRMTIELVQEGQPMPYVQRQLGHRNLAITSNYTASLPQGEIIDAMRGRPMPTVAAFKLRG